jgi:hypothetical protein
MKETDVFRETAHRYDYLRQSLYRNVIDLRLYRALKA